jgi:outer membrane protein W
MSSKILKAMVIASLATAPFAVYADSAPGEQKGDWIIRGGFGQINPKAENLELDDAFVVVDSDVSAVADVTYMFHNHFGVELLLAYPFTHGIDLKPFNGEDSRVGNADVLPPSLLLVWRPMDDQATFQPYLGAGVNYSIINGEETRGALSGVNLKLDDSVGPTGVVGLDIVFDEAKKWFVNGNARWINIESDAELSGTEIGTVEIDPWVFSLQIGRRFGAPAPAPVAAAAPTPPPPPPPPPPAPSKCADGDMDGVCDEMDKCPNTPAGTKVDKVGCPLEQTLKLLFDFDSAELRPESLTELERVVGFMNDVPFATALIEGHTDSVGSAEYNLKLSDRRAKAVFDYLTSRGVDPARLSSIGKGLTMPIADNATAEGRQLNRRVMLIRTDSGM